MKKETIVRIALGAPIGLTISYLITIVISLIIGDGNYHGVVPSLVEATGGELNAIIVQAVASLIYGAGWGGASVIFQRDDWSILRQTITHFLVTSLVTLPVAYFMHWMHHSLMGVVRYFGIFIVVYAIVWAALYSTAKRNVDQINAKVKQNK